MPRINRIELPEALPLDLRENAQTDLAFRVLELFALSQHDNVNAQTVPEFTSDEMQDMLDQYKDSIVYAAISDGLVDGVSIHHHDEQGSTFIEGVAVHPDARQDGIATQLAAAIVHDAHMQGSTRLQTNAQPSAAAADLAILRKLGYSAETKESNDSPYVKITVEL